MEIAGALALVTDASSGIEAATAEVLADRGARVGRVARRASRVRRSARPRRTS